MHSEAGYERRRTRWSLISSAVVGLGAATAIFGVVLWRAGVTSVGVPASALRWTVLPALFAVAASVGWAAGLAGWMLRRRQVGNAIGWLAGVSTVIIAIVAAKQDRPLPGCRNLSRPSSPARSPPRSTVTAHRSPNRCALPRPDWRSATSHPAACG